MNLSSPFGSVTQTQSVTVSDSAQIIFVADLFVEQYVGGAELTTEALISKSPVTVQKIHSKDVTVDLLKQGHQKYWIFGNFANLDLDLIPTIVANLRYSVLEYDYKYCKYRSPEKHLFAEQKKCDCENEQHGKMVSAFYYGAKSLWWMSEAQLTHYVSVFPFLAEKNNTVLSSVFDDEFFVTIKNLREENKDVERKGWIVLGSISWVKGADKAEEWCKEAGHDYEVVWNLAYPDLLAKLASAEGFVYLPRGKDTCPRMVIEAKLLGCKLNINNDVQNKNEEWFDCEDIQSIEEYLYGSRDLFWRNIMASVEYKPTISGYTTARNCIEQQYPWRASIASLLTFCDEVVVVDGGSTDGTWEALQKWAEDEEKLKIHQEVRDWTHKRFAVFDGAQKAVARSLCTKEFCWQMDIDEVAYPSVAETASRFCLSWPDLASLVALPVVEFWGSEDKVRIDVNPWKWRVSRNLPHITHGIPAQLRMHDADGDLYAAPGTDGCDYVHVDTFEPIPHVSFYNEQAHNARAHAVNGNPDALQAYQEWFQQCVTLLPSVKHYSWFDIGRKIRTYRDFWSKHWQSLYNIEQSDTVENNMFFDKKWEDVTDDDIDNLAKRLAEETGGHIFHAKVDWSRPTPSVRIIDG